MQRALVFTLVVLLANILNGSAQSAKPKSKAAFGLSVQNGRLMKGEKPFRGIGANYFSAFSRMLKNPGDTSSMQGLKQLSNAKIPFVRFMCGGFWPLEAKMIREQPAKYFALLDRFVHAAEENHIGLIPSLFWNPTTVPDIVGEPMDQYGNPNSKTTAYIRDYTAAIVSRYRNSPAIWGWEFGNEYNLSADLPNAAEWRQRDVWPELGTAAKRSERDDFQWRFIGPAMKVFAQTVRRFDPHRIIISGNAAPRPSAWHNLHDRSWQTDDAAQFEEILQRDNPDPINTLCIHLYHDKENQYSGPASSLDGAVAAANAVAQRTGKPLFIGEFGAERALAARMRSTFQQMLDSIVKHQIQLSAFWVFDLESQNADWNVNFQNDRAKMIAVVADANSRLQRDSKAQE